MTLAYPLSGSEASKNLGPVRALDKIKLESPGMIVELREPPLTKIPRTTTRAGVKKRLRERPEQNEQKETPTKQRSLFQAISSSSISSFIQFRRHIHSIGE
jgi:hypothetical protein